MWVVDSRQEGGWRLAREMAWYTVLTCLENTVWNEVEVKTQHVHLAAFGFHQFLENTAAHNS